MLFRMSAIVTATVVCCILMQILCVVSQKKLQLLGDTPTGALPRTPLGDFRPQTPSLPLCPPNNPVRSTPLIIALNTPMMYYVALGTKLGLLFVITVS